MSASGLAALARRFASVHARRCGSVVAFCRRFVSGLDVLLERFAIDSRPALRFWRGGLPSVHTCCLSRDKQDGLRYIAFLFRGSRSPFARSRGVGAVIWLGRFTSALAVYLWRFRRGYDRSWLCEKERRDGGVPFVMMRFYCGVLRSVHACLFSFVRKKETACGILRSYSAGRDRHSCVLAVLARLSAFAGSLRVWPFFCGDLDGVTGDAGLRGNGTGGAALVRFCATALALLCFPRGVRWGCAPQTAPKSLRLSGLSSRCGGVVLVRIRAAVTRVHGKTRPALIYGRAGRAVLR